MWPDRVPAPTRWSCWAMTCCCSTGRNTIRSEGAGVRSRPVIPAGITA